MKLIAAVSKNWGIGKDNKLLFSIPTDMKFFRTATMGKTVIMGRKTLESFPGGKPLKNRRNIVLSSGKSVADGAELAASVDDALKAAPDDAFVIGGENVYRQLLPYCDEAYITKVFEECEADAFFPNLDEDSEWYMEKEGEEISENGHRFRFCTYKRKEAGE